MNEEFARKTGSALFWKFTEHGGVKAIMLIRLFILARLLSPDDFGLLAISMIAVEVMTGLTDFGLVPALVQRAQVDDVHYRAAWTAGLLRAAGIAVAVIAIAPLVARIYEEPRAAALIQVLALRPLTEALASARFPELLRHMRFRSLAVIRLADAAVATIVAVALAPTIGVWALVAGTMAGPIAATLLSYFIAPCQPRLSFDRAATGSLIHFGRWIFFTTIVGLAGSSLVSLVITRQLGTAALGLYLLGARLAFLPAEVSGQVIADVTFPLYSRLQDARPKMAQAFQSVLIGMFALLLPASILLIVLAPALVELVLGPKWAGTVPIIRILAAVSIVGILGDAIFPMLKGIGRPHQVLVVESVQNLLLISALWFFTLQWGITGAALASMPAIIATQLIYAKYVHSVVSRPFAGALGPLMVIAGASGVGALAAIGVYEWLPSLTGLFLAVVSAFSVVALLYWITARRFGQGLLNNLAQAFPQVAVLTRLALPRPTRG